VSLAQEKITKDQAVKKEAYAMYEPQRVCPDEICGICHDTLIEGSQCVSVFCTSHRLRPDIHHLYHEDCINLWTATGSNLCPLCNTVMVDVRGAFGRVMMYLREVNGQLDRLVDTALRYLDRPYRVLYLLFFILAFALAIYPIRYRVELLIWVTTHQQLYPVNLEEAGEWNVYLEHVPEDQRLEMVHALIDLERNAAVFISSIIISLVQMFAFLPLLIIRQVPPRLR
jgi:hypothetical protein